MSEMAAVYRNVGPTAVALISFFIGLIGGSFSTVLTHHDRRMGTLRGHRSQCPTCRHVLGPLDLVPVLSFVTLMGHCRYCHVRIPLRYPLLEVGSGLAAGLSGYLWGWAGGLVGAVGWCGIAWSYAQLSSRRHHRLRSQQGSTLLEVLVATALISIALIPVLDALVLGGQAAWASQRRSLVLGLAQARLSEVASAAGLSGADLSGVDAMAGSINNVIDTGNGTSDTYQIVTEILPYPAAASNSDLREARVTVSCPTCAGKLGLPVRPVIVTTVVRRG